MAWSLSTVSESTRSIDCTERDVCSASTVEILLISRMAALVVSRRHAQIVAAVATIPMMMSPMASPTRVRKVILGSPRRLLHSALGTLPPLLRSGNRTIKQCQVVQQNNARLYKEGTLAHTRG